MKVEKIITSTEPIDIIFTGARLLTKEEAEALPERLRLYNGWWWTSSSGASDSGYAFRMCGFNGYIFQNLVNDAFATRPALIFESSALSVGDHISIAGLEFEVIKDGLAFCLSDIGKCAFCEDWYVKDANQYEKSDIKKFVDKWFKENVK